MSSSFDSLNLLLAIPRRHGRTAFMPNWAKWSNWLFADSLRSGQRAAGCLSLIQSARMNEHDPYACLKYVFTRLPPRKRPAALAHFWKLSCREASEPSSKDRTVLRHQTSFDVELCRTYAAFRPIFRHPVPHHPPRTFFGCTNPIDAFPEFHLEQIHRALEVIGQALQRQLALRSFEPNTAHPDAAHVVFHRAKDMRLPRPGSGLDAVPLFLHLTQRVTSFRPFRSCMGTSLCPSWPHPLPR